MTVVTLAPPGSGPIQTGTFLVQPIRDTTISGNGIGLDRTAIIEAAGLDALPGGASTTPCERWNVDHVALDDADAHRLSAWLRARDLWLAAIQGHSGSLRSTHEYLRIWRAFYETAHGCALLPWAVNGTHAQSWAVRLRERLAPASVNKHLSVLSSYYRFAARQFYQDGARLFHGENPFIGEYLRSQVSRFGRARFPSTAQVLAICDVIDTSTPVGLRDYCLIRGMFQTTRRLNEWLPLRWGDISNADTSARSFRCRLKGGHGNWQEIPEGLWDALEAYLRAARNWPPEPEHYLFCGLLPRPRWDRPLNAGYVYQLLRRYGRLAGVPADVCHPHGLRHAGAHYRRQCGATNYDLQTILGHRNIATTEIYCREVLDQPKDRLGRAVDDLFGPARIPCSRASTDTAAV